MAIETTSLLGLERVNLRQQALIALRRAITSGEISPGTHLAETDLAQKLMISRGTLREALRELQQEGLVTSGPRGRLLVRSLTPNEIHDIFIVRGALESLAAQLLVDGDGRDAAVESLMLAVDRMEEAVAVGLEERIETDLDFHRTLCVLTTNETLVTSWVGLEGAIRLSIMYGGVDRAVENMDAHRHSDIVDAIASGDSGQARDTIMAHMSHASRNLVRVDAPST
ncbi:MAG: GntR family transcriptional regulator [Glaciihabitans sp.]|nr:GntR family transcriptional regulator [Glaciihabitans sp.]